MHLQWADVNGISDAGPGALEHGERHVGEVDRR
jgi:hypothetical protein